MKKLIRFLIGYKSKTQNNNPLLAFTNKNFEIDTSVKILEPTILNISSINTFLKIDENVEFRCFCNILLYSGASLTIQRNVFFNNYCSINCLGDINIGENTLFGEGVKIYDHNHLYEIKKEGLIVEKNKFNIGKIIIGKNCWIGSNVTILNNVEIGDNVIIGANNLIYKSIPSNAIVKAKIDASIEIKVQE